MRQGLESQARVLHTSSSMGEPDSSWGAKLRKMHHSPPYQVSAWPEKFWGSRTGKLCPPFSTTCLHRLGQALGRQAEASVYQYPKARVSLAQVRPTMEVGMQNHLPATPGLALSWEGQIWTGLWHLLGLASLVLSSPVQASHERKSPVPPLQVWYNPLDTRYGRGELRKPVLAPQGP